MDDFFGAERSACAKHALSCIERIVKLMLGNDAVAAEKCEWGATLTILGVDVAPQHDGFVCTISAKKAQKCSEAIQQALVAGRLSAGDAKKLAGRLNWATQFLFKRLGRGMLRPIFAQSHRWSPQINQDLEDALIWWQVVLQKQSAEKHAWSKVASSPAHLWVDARGVPPRCAAVLCIDGEIFFTDGAPSPAVTSQFHKRADNQITTLEILAISVGLSTFADLLEGREVVVYSDNVGAEASVRKGSSSAQDQCKLIHEIWSLALTLKLHLWIVRVPSDDNISDEPSREVYGTVRDQLKASWRAPKLAKLFLAGDELAAACTGQTVSSV